MNNQLRENTEATPVLTLTELLAALKHLIRFWPLLAAGIVVGLIASFIFNRYTPDEYSVSAVVAVEETENPLASSIDGVLNLGLGSAEIASFEVISTMFV